MKLLILLFTIYCSLFSNEKFKEIRYIASLDIEQYKYGNIKVTNDVLTVIYSEPSKETLSYYSDKLTIKNGDEIKEYSFSEYPQIEYMGLILKSIINNNYSSIDELFSVEVENSDTILNAKPVIADTMEYIRIQRKEEVVKKITIYMINEDTITIETVN